MNTRKFLSLSLLILLSTPMVFSQDAKLPDTPAARRLSAFLKSFNSGDQKTMREFHLNNAAQSVLARMSADEISRMDSQFYNETGGVEVRRVAESADHSITVLLQAKKGQWISLRLQVEPSPPHKLTGLGIEEADPPAEPSSKPAAADPDFAARLENFINEQARADAFSGTVIVAKDGKTIFEKACGLASRSFNVPNNIDTKFNLGSMNKMFTAVAIAQLAERGKLSFDDRVGKLIPDFPNKQIAEKVTIHHLLTHTSGMGSYFNEKYQRMAKDLLREVKDYMPLIVDEPLEFEPGAKWQYSNSGFMLLGLIVEKISGMNYFDYIRENIYKKAGMTDSDCYEMDTDVPNLAIGYTKMGPDEKPLQGGRKNNLFLHVVKGGPAGGGFSTARDLLKFDIALRSNKLLGAKYTDIVLTGKADTPRRGAKYAYGFIDRRAGATRIVGHGGGFAGINSNLDMYLDSGYTVVVMSNYDPPAAQQVSEKIRQLLTQ